MGMLAHLMYPWGLIFQVLAILHYIRRRPAQYWLYIIIFFGPIGALIYLIVEALPDLGIFAHTLNGFSRRKRISQIEGAIIDNPSAGNYEELGDVFFEEGNFPAARSAYDKAIAGRSDTLDCFYHRAICALQLGDAAAAVPDLEFVVIRDSGHDFHRAAGLLAHACALTGQQQRAEALFQHAVASSTLSETYLNFADMLAAQGRAAEARVWVQKVIDKERTMPAYLRRRERRWLNRAAETLKKLADPSPPAPRPAR